MDITINSVHIDLLSDIIHCRKKQNQDNMRFPMFSREISAHILLLPVM